jgi:signal transduction histidine kinase
MDETLRVVRSRVARRISVTLRKVRRRFAPDVSSELRLHVEELRASRARVVTAADAERREIERDLHDGVQQHLVALAVNVQLARQLTEADLAGAQALLEEMARNVREALESVRALAQRIYPPLLVDRGLAEALAGAASAAGIPTRVEATGLDRYPDDLEATVYFCCLEALRDAAQHAPAGARATVGVWADESTLHFEVADDCDLAPAAQKRSMSTATSDRIGALGGQLTISSNPGHGTRLVGEIPLPR